MLLAFALAFAIALRSLVRRLTFLAGLDGVDVVDERPFEALDEPLPLVLLPAE